MRVRMKTRIQGDGINGSPGQVIDTDPVRASALVSGGFADAIDEPVPAVEVVPLPLVEHAVVRPEFEIPERTTRGNRK